MSEWVELLADDGNELKGYVARSAETPKAGLVVVQEIFGVNEQIQHTTDEWATEGYLCIAPAMFDRFQKDVNLAYTQEGFTEGLALMGKFAPDLTPQALDVASAVEWLRTQGVDSVGVVGFCFGGTMAWVSACRLPVQAAVAYYGGSIAKLIGEEPKVPIALHFGADDPYIPDADREAILAAHPEVPLFVYPNAGHAFNRKLDPNHYVAEAATLANNHTRLFFEQHLVF